MSTREPDHRASGELAPFARDAAAQLDRQIARARPAPDFAAMLARARELDADAVDAEDIARAEALPPVIPLARGEARDDVAVLAPFTSALRAELDARLAERRLASIPPPPLPRRRRVGLLVGVAAALAAAVLLAVLGPGLVARRADDGGVAAKFEGGGGQIGEVRASATTELHAEPAPGETGRAPGLEDMPEQPGGEHTGGQEDMSNTTGLKDHVQTDMSQQPGHSAEPTARPRKAVSKDSPRRRPPAVDPAPGLSLEDEAQLLWQKGELAAAERKYRQILDLAGTSLRAELAYGDLFALARQLRGGEGQAAVWREYLKRFPAGRFADDARGGLCRRGPADARAACWRDYLEHHPTGAHRKQAEAALAATGQQEAP